MDGQKLKWQFELSTGKDNQINPTFCPQLFDEKWFILSNVLVPQNIIVFVEAGAAQQMHRPETSFIVSALTMLRVTCSVHQTAAAACSEHAG